MKKFNWRRIEVGDYKDILVNWWNEWGWPVPPPIDTLPYWGVLVYDEETKKPLYAGFLYETGTALGWIEYVISNPSKELTQLKRGAVEYLVETLSSIAKTKNIRTLFSSTIERPFCNSLRKAGFVIGDENVTHLMKQLY